MFVKIWKFFDSVVDKIFCTIKCILKYLRVNDENNRISLTNLGMMLVLYKIWLTQVTTFQDITALAIAVLGYQGKRVIDSKKTAAPKNLADDFNEMAEGGE